MHEAWNAWTGPFVLDGGAVRHAPAHFSHGKRVCGRNKLCRELGARDRFYFRAHSPDAWQPCRTGGKHGQEKKMPLSRESRAALLQKVMDSMTSGMIRQRGGQK